MSASSTASASSIGRDSSGRFTARNRFGPGNPYARQVAEYRRAIHRAVSPDEFQALARRYYDLAMEGDTAAAKLIFPYLAGKPMEPPVEPDLVDAHEWHVWQQNIAQSGELDFVVDSPLKSVLCEFVATLTPLMEQVWKDHLAEMVQPSEPAESAEKGAPTAPKTEEPVQKPKKARPEPTQPSQEVPNGSAGSATSGSSSFDRQQTAKSENAGEGVSDPMEVVANMLVRTLLEHALLSANGAIGSNRPAN